MMVMDEEAAKQVIAITPTDPGEDDLLYLEEYDDHNHTHHHLGQRGKVKVRESKRTLVSKGESGFVSENTLNSASNNLQKRGKYFNFSSSSIFRKVLRLGPRNEGVIVGAVGNTGRVSTSKQTKSNKKRRFGKGRRARRADLEAAIMRSGQGIGNKSFIGSTSTVHQNQGLRRTGALNSSGKSRVSSL